MLSMGYTKHIGSLIYRRSYDDLKISQCPDLFDILQIILQQCQFTVKILG